MSHNSFDDAIVTRLDSSFTQSDTNAITINSLSVNDFKEFDYSRFTGRLSGTGDIARSDIYKSTEGGFTHFSGKDIDINIIELKPIFEGKTGIRGSEIDCPSKYPIPVEAEQQTGESALHRLNERITDNAVKKVQERMTPAEKRELNRDAEKYAEAMRKYEEEMRTAMMQHWLRGPNDWPKFPAKPQSIVKYEEAVDKEIEKTVRRLGL